MKILNLVYPENSDIKYKIQKFPDGQQNVVILGEIETFRVDGDHPKDYYWEKRLVKVSGKYVQIKSRLNNWLDLELIICTVAALRELGVEEIHLYTPYIMGARSDRKFEEGSNNYLRDVICPIINSLDFKTVTCIDPHSDVLEACIQRFKKISNTNLVKFALSNPTVCGGDLEMLGGDGESGEGMENPFFMKCKKCGETNFYNEKSSMKGCHMASYDHKKDFILISPDAGASKKVYKIAEQIGYKGDIITCSKSRDESGKLTKTIVPLTKEILITHPSKDYIIIDDICDGGATFINISKEIKLKIDNWNNNEGRLDRITSKIYLIVTHGIFSKGFEELSKYFDGIYCTNSYKDIPELNPSIKQLNVY